MSIMIKHMFVILGVMLCLMSHPQEAQAGFRYRHGILNSSLACRTNNLTKPRTRYAVWKAYQWFVNVNDGVTKKEALIMAQYEVVQKGLDQNYHLAKPKILSETQGQWVVRLPGKFSLTKGKADMYVVCINKEKGNLLCSRIEEENEP